MNISPDWDKRVWGLEREEQGADPSWTGWREEEEAKSLSLSLWSLKGKYMDVEFDFKGSPLGGVITNCTCLPIALTTCPTCPYGIPFG